MDVLGFLSVTMSMCFPVAMLHCVFCSMLLCIIVFGFSGYVTMLFMCGYVVSCIFFIMWQCLYSWI